MAFLTDNPGNIMTSRGARALLDDIRKRLSARMAEMESRDYLALMHKIRDELLREESVNSWIADEIASLQDKLVALRLPDDIRPLHDRLTELSARHFTARSSVSTLHELSGRSLETLLATATTIAADLLRQEGDGEPGCAWTLLASDDLGRREATLKGHNAIIFIHEDGPADLQEYFKLLALRLMAILGECGISLKIGLHRNGHVFWHGSLNRWRELLMESTGAPPDGQPAKDILTDALQADRYARAIEIIADIRPICGDMQLAGRVTEMTDAFLARERSREQFRQLARRVATMPVALGIFGRFRTARSGKHRGEFSLEEMATRPLIASVRMMAIASGIRERSTGERIRALLATGNLGVALADRLLVALHDFGRCRIELEMTERVEGEEYYFNPDLLPDRARERFRAGLEDLTTLQRLAYQQIVEAEQQ